MAGFLGISPYWDAFLGNLAGPLLLQLRPLQAAIFFLAAPKLMFFFFEKIKLMIFGCFFGFDPYSCPAGFVELWWCGRGLEPTLRSPWPQRSEPTNLRHRRALIVLSIPRCLLFRHGFEVFRCPSQTRILKYFFRFSSMLPFSFGAHLRSL